MDWCSETHILRFVLSVLILTSPFRVLLTLLRTYTCISTSIKVLFGGKDFVFSKLRMPYSYRTVLCVFVLCKCPCNKEYLDLPYVDFVARKKPHPVRRWRRHDFPTNASPTTCTLNVTSHSSLAQRDLSMQECYPDQYCTS